MEKLKENDPSVIVAEEVTLWLTMETDTPVATADLQFLNQKQINFKLYNLNFIL